MSTRRLQSCLAEKIQSFIELRRLSGTSYESQARLLGYFDRFLAERRETEPRITCEIADAYERSIGYLQPRSRENRLSVVRQFCRYLARTNPRCYVPEPSRTVHSEEVRLRHIYSTAEVRAILAAASRLPPPESPWPETYRTLVGLLYSTGIRIGEALALNLEDFHSNQQALWISEGKFRKARWVPLSFSACRQLQQYVERRRRFSPQSPDSSLLLNQRSRRPLYCNVRNTFLRLLAQCGIPYSKHTGPRIHDLRHYADSRIMPTPVCSPARDSGNPSNCSQSDAA